VSQAQTKTEKPTERRRRESRREGKTARSQEVGVALSLFSLVVALRLIFPATLPAVANSAVTIFEHAGRGEMSTGITSSVITMFVVGLTPFLGLAFISALAGGIMQVGFRLAPKAAKPKLSNLSPKKGLQQFKPSTFLWNLARTAIKIGLLALVVWAPISLMVGGLGIPLGLDQALSSMADSAWKIIIGATFVAVVVAASDYAITRYKAEKELKMTRSELKEEVKSTEGDPLIKQQRRRRASQLSRNRMIGNVALADVVVTNPTHFAIALRYRGGDAAPRVLAKGADKLAARIKAEAYRNGVVVIEDKPLTRALYRTVKVDGYVPGALFEAVAVVLAVAYRRTGRKVA